MLILALDDANTAAISVHALPPEEHVWREARTADFHAWRRHAPIAGPRRLWRRPAPLPTRNSPAEVLSQFHSEALASGDC